MRLPRPELLRNSLQAALVGSACLLAASAQAAALDRVLTVVATVDATQSWEKNDPKYPARQWSKGSTRQRYELRVPMRSDGVPQVRNLLDPNLEARLEAKTVHLARLAKKAIEASGGKLKLPTTPAEEAELGKRMQYDQMKCRGDAACNQEMQLFYAAILAATQYPDAMEDEDEPGRYLHYLPYKGCAGSSRVTLTMEIAGERWNKTVDRLVPFREVRNADSRDASDGLSLCSHFTMVFDPEDSQRPLWVENVHIPSPVGVTEFTESQHTSRATEPQPMPTAALEWITETLRHAPASGKASTTLRLPLSLNGNSTWLGLWSGTAKVSVEWSFTPVSSPVTSPSAPR
ncbi:MAG: hypothetical protein QE272_05880 [Nevskia sp.]|nr:hypothetical protein [Nevskia sp.]